MFLKTGLLYKLYTNGKVERVIPNDVVTPDIVKTVLGIKEEGTRNLLKEAIALHYSHAPNAARGSVERLWDAFERMKTYYTDLGKLHSVSKIVADMAGDSQTFYDIFDKEFRWLTNAGIILESGTMKLIKLKLGMQGIMIISLIAVCP